MSAVCSSVSFNEKIKISPRYSLCVHKFWQLCFSTGPLTDSHHVEHKKSTVDQSNDLLNMHWCVVVFVLARCIDVLHVYTLEVCAYLIWFIQVPYTSRCAAHMGLQDTKHYVYDKNLQIRSSEQDTNLIKILTWQKIIFLQDGEAAAMNYAALDFSTRRVKKGKKKECVYSVVRAQYQNQWWLLLFTVHVTTQPYRTAYLEGKTKLSSAALTFLLTFVTDTGLIRACNATQLVSVWELFVNTLFITLSYKYT